MGRIPYRPAIPVTKRTPPLAGAPATLQKFQLSASPQTHRGSIKSGRVQISGNADMRPSGKLRRG